MKQEAQQAFKKIQPVKEGRFGLASSLRNVFHLTTEPGTTKEQIENPAYWANVAYKLLPFSKVEVVCEDRSYYAEYLVTDANRMEARVKCLSFVELTEKAELTKDVEIGEFNAKWRGPSCLWSVIRTSDLKVMAEKLASEADAIAWINNHNRQV